MQCTLGEQFNILTRLYICSVLHPKLALCVTMKTIFCSILDLLLIFL